MVEKFFGNLAQIFFESFFGVWKRTVTENVERMAVDYRRFLRKVERLHPFNFWFATKARSDFYAVGLVQDC